MKKIAQVWIAITLVGFIGLLGCSKIEENPVIEKEQEILNTEYHDDFNEDMQAISSWFKSILPYKEAQPEPIIIDTVITVDELIDEIENNPMLAKDKYANNIAYVQGEIGFMSVEDGVYFYFEQFNRAWWSTDIKVTCSAEQMRQLTRGTTMTLAIIITEFDTTFSLKATLIDIVE